MLPSKRIREIILIGSSVKYSFLGYKSPGFRGSLFSDFDFIVFVEDNFKIPSWLDRELERKPFQDNSLNLAYRKKKFIENKCDIEVFFIRLSSLQDSKLKN